VASLQVVIRDARAEMMNVMKADIARKPLKYFGKFVKGASFKRCLCVIPIITSFPVDTIKLVLHIEQPNTGRTGNTDNDKLQEKISLKSKDKTHDRTHGENGEIHPVNRATLCFVRPGRRKTVPDKKQVKRSDDKQNKWVSGKAIREAAPARSFQILLNGHGHNVPNAAFVEMPGTGVVNVVFPAPMLGGRESQHSGDEPDDIIGATGFQVRAMATIVEDNKSSHEQTSREQSQRWSWNGALRVATTLWPGGGTPASLAGGTPTTTGQARLRVVAAGVSPASEGGILPPGSASADDPEIPNCGACLRRA